MKRGDGKVKGVAAGIVWHHTIRDVCLNSFRDGIIQVKEREPASQFEHVRLIQEFSTVQLILYSKAGDEFIGRRHRSVKPPPSPILTGDHFGFRPSVEVETDDSGLKINSGHRVESQFSTAERLSPPGGG